jgi:hypothetical protein
MELNQQEQRMVERLRKKKRHWRWVRWMLLVIGISSAGLCIAIFYLVVPSAQSQSQDASSSALLLSVSFPIILIFASQATVCLSPAIRDWHGNATHTLLLRLLDECKKRSVGDDHAA